MGGALNATNKTETQGNPVSASTGDLIEGMSVRRGLAKEVDSDIKDTEYNQDHKNQIRIDLLEKQGISLARGIINKLELKIEDNSVTINDLID